MKKEPKRNAHGAAEVLIRQILLLNVTEVFQRPENERQSNLSQGEWMRFKVGDFASLIRRAYAQTAAA